MTSYGHYFIYNIKLNVLHGLAVTSSRANNIVNIPYGRATGYGLNAEPLVLRLSGNTFEDRSSQVTAKQKRLQLIDLFNNPSHDQVIFKFLYHPEYDGWYVLDDLSFSPQPGNDESFPFTATVRRLAGLQDMSEGAIFTYKPFDSDYSDYVPWYASIMSGLATAGLTQPYRQTVNGTYYIVLDPQVVNPGIKHVVGHSYGRDYLGLINAYNETFNLTNLHCKVYDTTIDTYTTSDPQDPRETYWIERYGTNITTQGDMVIHNGLIRFVWDNTTNDYRIYVYTGSLGSQGWIQVMDSIDFAFSASPVSVAPISQPVIEYFDSDLVVFTIMHASADQNRTFPVRFRMKRGTYFIEVSAKSTNGSIQASTNMAMLSSSTFNSYDHNVTTANYTSVLTTYTATGVILRHGFLHTRVPSPAGAGGALQLGYTALENERLEFAMFATREPIGSLGNGTTLQSLGKEYLSNSRIKRVLIDPRLGV